MNNDDLLKKIESLESRVKELESQKKGNLALFGRSYSLAGNSDSDFLIKTKGQVKIQWGSKFIDLIKDGKINVDALFIFQAKSTEKLGVKDGIYVLPDGAVYLKSGDLSINLAGEIGNTFVSFLAEQETDSEAKHTALTNIGFLYPSLTDVDAAALKNGIIYIESELKLYTVQNGELNAFSIQFPNPYTELFIVAKETAGEGAIVIRGEGISNSLAFDSLFLYSEYGNSFIDSKNKLYFAIAGSNKVEITDSLINFLVTATSSKFQSPGATENSGFRLYVADGASVLEVDKLIVRSSESEDEDKEFIIPVYWFKNNNVISLASNTDLEGADFELHLKYLNTYQVGDKLYVYLPLLLENSTSPLLVKIPIVITLVDAESAQTMYVKIEKSILGEEVIDALDDETLASSLAGKTIFYICGTTPSIVLRRASDSLDVVEISDFEAETVIARIGDISSIDSTYSNGIYSRVALLENIHSTNITTDNVIATTGNILTLLSTSGNIANLKSANSEINRLKTYDGIFEKALFLGAGWDNVPYYSSELNQKLLSASELSSHYKLVVPTIEWVLNYIESLVKPGYYWSATKNGNNPVNPEYIGPSSEGFSVSEEQPYLWYTSDGANFVLRDMFISPSSSKVYVISSGRGVYADNVAGHSYYFPGGFLQYYKNGGTVSCGLGLDGYTDIISTSSPVSLTKLGQLLSNADPGGIPSAEGYDYIWSINVGDDMTDCTKWKLEASFGVDTSLIRTILSDDWGNQSCSPGFTVWAVDANNRITGAPDSSIYMNGYGTPNFWRDETWRLSFLRHILSKFLVTNKHRYNKNLGWTLNWDGPVTSTGFGGVWTARVGGIQPPTSNNPNDIGYKPTASLSNLLGYTIGNGYMIHFYFKDVRLGDKLALGKGGRTMNVGDVVTYPDCYYNISYGSYSAVIKELELDTVIEI